MPASLFWSQDALRRGAENGDGAISTEIGERTVMRRKSGGAAGHSAISGWRKRQVPTIMQIAKMKN
jgi:hypothetical protein